MKSPEPLGPSIICLPRVGTRRTSILPYYIEGYERFANSSELAIPLGFKSPKPSRILLSPGEIILNMGLMGCSPGLNENARKSWATASVLLCSLTAAVSISLKFLQTQSTPSESHRYFHTTLKFKYYFRLWIYMKAPWFHVICQPDLFLFGELKNKNG